MNKEKDFNWCNDSGYSDVFDNNLCECTAPQVNDGMCICGRPINNTTMNDNKLIAEFMGVPNVGTNSRPIFDYGEMVGCRSLEDLHYHHAWNWLMPVVQKIMDVSFFNGEPEDFYVVRDCIPEISDTYKEVVEFIKLYNEKE